MTRALARFLHNLFSQFDELAAAKGVYKIETIGCVGPSTFA